MSTIEMKIPSPGESVTEVQIARWLKKDGDFVEKDEEICEVDSDKATLTLNAESDGKLTILVKEGETIPVGTVVCSIDTSIKNSVAKETKAAASVKAVKETKPREKPVSVISAPAAAESEKNGVAYAKGVPSVSAAKIMREQGISAGQVSPSGKGGRITKADVISAVSAGTPSLQKNWGAGRAERREKMSMLRRKVSERLVAVKQETAMLTTFNEVDMSAIMSIRKIYKDSFKEAHGVGLGFMSFFTKAVCEALRAFPAVNARIDGQEIVYHDYCDIGIAVSAPKGLMVPVIRNAEAMSMAEIESAVMDLASKARDGKLSIEEMSGGTFTITNGGVFGSMLSTPIINPPQSAILGMHNIVERPVAVNGDVQIRPVMYVALSYDHRIIDGRESVGFLVKVKQMLEEPVKMLFGGNDPVKAMLGL
jgi:2-oxoglutarate dehydrogenase E2 component (dihydrolipoamide succinyltransferase)